MEQAAKGRMKGEYVKTHTKIGIKLLEGQSQHWRICMVITDSVCY